jgi:hypothetical protein
MPKILEKWALNFVFLIKMRNEIFLVTLQAWHKTYGNWFDWHREASVLQKNRCEMYMNLLGFYKIWAKFKPWLDPKSVQFDEHSLNRETESFSYCLQMNSSAFLSSLNSRRFKTIRTLGSENEQLTVIPRLLV